MFYKSCLFALSFVGASFCMEQQIVKYEKRMPDHVRNILDRSKKYKGQCNSSCGWCGGGPALHREEKWHALICATYYEDRESVKNLLENKALDEDALKYTYNDKILNISSFVATFPRLHVLPLTIALHTQNQDIITLLKNESDLEDDMCPIEALAAYIGDVDLLNQCIANDDFDPFYNDKLGGGLLKLAVRNGHEKMVERLLQLRDIKEHINNWRFDGAPVLFIAAQRGFCGIAEKLCAAGGDPEMSYEHPHDRVETRPLGIAARCKNTAMVKLLCKQPGDIANRSDTHGDTALHIAVSSDDAATMKVLLAVPTIKVDVKNKSGKTPLDIAQKKGHYNCECLLWRWLDKNKLTQ